MTALIFFRSFAFIFSFTSNVNSLPFHTNYAKIGIIFDTNNFFAKNMLHLVFFFVIFVAVLEECFMEQTKNKPTVESILMDIAQTAARLSGSTPSLMVLNVYKSKAGNLRRAFLNKMKNIVYILRCVALVALLLPVRAMADTKGERLLERADSLYAVQQYKEALSVAREALPLTKGTEAEADCLNLLAIINIRLSDYDEAARYAKECYAIDEQSGDPDVMSSSLNTLAAIYMGANQPKEAEHYVLKGIEMAEKADNPGRMAVLQAMASEVYHALGDDKTALPYIERAYEIDKQQGNEPRAMVRLAQKASVLVGLHDYRQAEATLREVIPYLRHSPDRQSLGIACNKMGMALLSQQREHEAVSYFREAADIFMQLGDPYNEVHARRGLYESLWKQDPDEAKRQLDRFNELKDSNIIMCRPTSWPCIMPSLATTG